MAVEFISAVNVNPSNELNQLARADIDLPFFKRYVNALEDAGFDYTLCAYASSLQDQFAIANQLVARSERVAPIIALRPNTIYPTLAAKALATLDQFGQGRAVVHFISGGSDAEQAREGDYLPKDKRYARTAEYVDIVRKTSGRNDCWRSRPARTSTIARCGRRRPPRPAPPAPPPPWSAPRRRWPRRSWTTSTSAPS